MTEKRITSDNFDRELRETLRYKHGFDHADLERTKGIISDVVEHVGNKAETRHGMGGQHLDMATKFLNEDHAEWKKLPEHKKAHIMTALKEHFGISDA